MLTSDPTGNRGRYLRGSPCRGEGGGDQEKELSQVYNTNSAMRHSFVQNLIADGMRFRLAQRSVSRAVSRPIPNVQKPGYSRAARDLARRALTARRPARWKSSLRRMRDARVLKMQPPCRGKKGQQMSDGILINSNIGRARRAGWRFKQEFLLKASGASRSGPRGRRQFLDQQTSLDTRACGFGSKAPGTVYLTFIPAPQCGALTVTLTEPCRRPSSGSRIARTGTREKHGRRRAQARRSQTDPRNGCSGAARYFWEVGRQ